MILRKAYGFSAQGFSELGRDLRQMLNAQEGGIKHGDNVGPVLTCRYLSGRQVNVHAPVNRRPRAIACSAVNRTDGIFEDNLRIVWKWGPANISVVSIDVSDTNDEYDVTLRLWME